MIIGKEDVERVLRLEGVMSRLLEANRWLSEFDVALDPMWDFIFGKKITVVMDEKGRTLERMAEGDISQMREKLRAMLTADRGEKEGS